MAQYTKAQLQAKARAKGIKGYNTMTVDQLKRAIAKAPQRAKRKAASTRRTKRSTRRGMADRGWSKYDFIESVEQAKAEAAEYGDDEMDAVYQLIDNEVIYNYQAAQIVMELAYYSGWSDSEYAPFDNISQLAFAALVEFCNEEGLF
jgi:hypothetical protein